MYPGSAASKPGMAAYHNVFAHEMRKGWRAAIIVGVALLITVLCAALGAFKFASKCSFSFAPSSSLECYDAYVAVGASFPALRTRGKEALLVTRKDGAAVLGPAARALHAGIQAKLGAPLLAAAQQQASASFYILNGTSLQPLATAYISPADPHKATAMLIVVTVDKTKALGEWVAAFAAMPADLANSFPEFSIVATGAMTAQAAAQVVTGKGFGMTNGIGLPFIGIIFWWRVGSVRLLLLPMMTTGISLIISYGIGSAVASHTVVPGYEPDIMLFLCLALSVDYSFFLLTRLQEERANGATMCTAVSRMLTHSGHVVLVSGSILVITWIALCFFPVNGLDVVGYCSAITVLLCMTTNLVLTPAMLIVFENFFARGGISASCRCCCCKEDKAVGGNVYSTPSGAEPIGPDRHFGVSRGSVSSSSEAGLGKRLLGQHLVGEAPPAPRSRYYRMARVMTTQPWSIVVPICVFTVFIIGCLPLLHIQFKLYANIDFGSGPASTALGTIALDFPRVAISTPFAVMVKASAAGGVFSSALFSEACNLASALQKEVQDIALPGTGVAYTTAGYPGAAVTCAPLAAEAKLRWAQRRNGSSPAATAMWAWYANDTISAKEDALLITFQPKFNPLSDSAKLRLLARQVRAVLATRSASASHQQFFYGDLLTGVDAEAFTLNRFPVVIVGTLLVIFTLIALRFGAALIPFKLALTIVLPIVFLFGIAVAIYQDGALNFVGWHAISGSKSGGISWLLPCSTVFLLIGLALDYDIFLFSRVYELRRTGRMGTTEAICEAVDVSGPVITSAGLIMALAFAGMLANSNKYLNEFGFVAISGVLIDTFVVRTILVPAVLSLGGNLNWWPSKMPEVGDFPKAYDPVAVN